MPQDTRVAQKGDAPATAAVTVGPAGTRPAVVEGAPAEARSPEEGLGRPPRAPEAQEPRTREEAREAITRARDRISTTLDEIEVRLRQKQAELKERTDIPARLRDLVRGRELPALLGALGAGFVVALLLGGRGSRREVTLSRDEVEALRSWREERERIAGGLERLAEALEEAED